MLNLSKRLTSDSQRSIPLLLVLIVCALTAVSVSAQSVPAPLLAGDVVIEGSAANSIGPTEPVAYDVTVLGPKIAARIHSGNYSDNAPTPATGVGGLPSSSIWQWRQPLPQGNALHAVAAGNNTYVAVGDAGTVLSAPYLPDAVRDWTPTAPIIRQSLFDVAFRANALAPAGEGVFVAVGASGAVIRSTDGNRWSAVDSGTGTDLRQLTHGPSGFVAVGGTTLLAASPDGLTWSSVDIGIAPPTEEQFPWTIQNVTYGNGRYVALVDLGPSFATPDEAARVLISTDAVQWQAHPFQVPADHPCAQNLVFFRGVAFGEGYFVGAGICVDINGTPHEVVARSVDGVAWKWVEPPTTDEGVPLFLLGDSLVYDAVNGRFVALADVNDPPLPSLQPPAVVASENGGAWFVLIDSTVHRIDRIGFARAGLFGLSPWGEIYASGDGSAWTPTTAAIRATRLTDLEANGSTMVASGVGRPYDRSRGVILSSTDGSTWNAVALPVPQGFLVVEIYALAQGAGVFVACAVEAPAEAGSGVPERPKAIYVSLDGASWTRVDLQALGDIESITSAAYGNGVFVVTANDSDFLPVVLRSVDSAATWQRHSIAGVDTSLGTVVHGDSGFIAIPQDFGTMVFRSSDGVQWSGVDAWPAAGGRLVDVAHHDGTYLIVGQAFENGRTADWLLRSTDGGQSWQAARVNDYVVDGAALSSNRSGFVLGTVGGDVLFSADGLSWTASWSGAYRGAVGSVEDDRGRLWIATSGGGILERTALFEALFVNGFE